ncbi:MAG: cell division protein FtsB [Nitrosomonadales bacterium]|nr:cell division protein FtsB [Nitrosomonadales bacterium]MBT3917862.1 cell division protein FtsB [Nitrosomonadales bacterium]MBT4182785.1 cell division protein FtsB [Nitrosomonadales bacterium]MBT4571371.1 cell division protein FtsB [Nitrosomonadales bacterium]MBT4759781.1 cell division protein FtsB [Nitrosomonadales bacterium]
MRVFSIILFSLLVLIQYPLWIGKGSWYDVFKLKQMFNQQYKTNLELSKENFALRAEVSDLSVGTDAIEERARYELGMVKKDEFFFQVINK